MSQGSGSADHDTKLSLISGLEKLLRSVKLKIRGTAELAIAGYGLGPWRSMFVCFLILPSSFLQVLSISA